MRPWTRRRTSIATAVSDSSTGDVVPQVGQSTASSQQMSGSCSSNAAWIVATSAPVSLSRGPSTMRSPTMTRSIPASGPTAGSAPGSYGASRPKWRQRSWSVPVGRRTRNPASSLSTLNGSLADRSATARSSAHVNSISIGSRQSRSAQRNGTENDPPTSGAAMPTSAAIRSPTGAFHTTSDGAGVPAPSERQRARMSVMTAGPIGSDRSTPRSVATAPNWRATNGPSAPSALSGPRPADSTPGPSAIIARSPRHAAHRPDQADATAGSPAPGSWAAGSGSQPSISTLIDSTAMAFALASKAGTAVNSLTQAPCRK